MTNHTCLGFAIQMITHPILYGWLFLNFFLLFAFSDFFLLGVICGLAIYNDNIVDLHFPLALYKKLLNVEPNLDDLTEMMPSVGRSMKQLIEAQERDFTKGP